MTIYCYDLSASILDFSNRPLQLPTQQNQATPVATFSHFSLLALMNAYEGEILSYEAKAYRIDLAKRIKSNPTATNLTFIDRMLITELVNRVSQAPIIFQRFIEFFERTDVPTLPIAHTPSPTPAPAPVREDEIASD